MFNENWLINRHLIQHTLATILTPMVLKLVDGYGLLRIETCDKGASMVPGKGQLSYGVIVPRVVVLGVVVLSPLGLCTIFHLSIKPHTH